MTAGEHGSTFVDDDTRTWSAALHRWPAACCTWSAACCRGTYAGSTEGSVSALSSASEQLSVEAWLEAVKLKTKEQTK